jgi:hypothetical protein
MSNSFYWRFEGTALFLIFVHLWSWIFGSGRNENQISKQAAIVKLIAPENNSTWTSMPSSTVTGNKRTNHTRLIMRNRSSFFL